MTRWTADDSRYETTTLELRDGERATLVHLAPPSPTDDAVLHVHGYSDYFFQDHLADAMAARGLAFWAIDLRRCGRSWREGEVPHLVAELDEHFEELDAAVAAMTAAGARRVVVHAHSTGGLIAALWLDARRGSATTRSVAALVLNAPWLDLDGTPKQRLLAGLACATAGRVRPEAVVSRGLGVYGRSLHRDHHGEWTFDTERKPLDGFPVRAGFLRAVRRGHRRVRRGLDPGVPVLVLRSASSRLAAAAFADDLLGVDAVLDVETMRRLAPRLGRDVTDVPLDGALHDVLLSRADVRERALAALDAFLARVLAS